MAIDLHPSIPGVHGKDKDLHHAWPAVQFDQHPWEAEKLAFKRTVGWHIF
jgi:hypothetical protein